MMTFPLYGKIKNVPNHQPDDNFSDLQPNDVITSPLFRVQTPLFGDPIQQRLVPLPKQFVALNTSSKSLVKDSTCAATDGVNRSCP